MVEAVDSATREVSPRGPRGGAGAAVMATVTIEAIDTGTNTVAFRRSDGSVHMIAVKITEYGSLFAC